MWYTNIILLLLRKARSLRRHSSVVMGILLIIQTSNYNICFVAYTRRSHKWCNCPVNHGELWRIYHVLTGELRTSCNIELTAAAVLCVTPWLIYYYFMIKLYRQHGQARVFIIQLITQNSGWVTSKHILII